MALRWIHKGWKGFWKIIFSLLLIVATLGGGVLALLQLDATKDVIIEKIENDSGKFLKSIICAKFGTRLW